MNDKNQVFIWNELKQIESLEHWIEIYIGFSAINMRYMYGKNKRFNNSYMTNFVKVFLDCIVEPMNVYR